MLHDHLKKIDESTERYISPATAKVQILNLTAELRRLHERLDAAEYALDICRKNNSPSAQAYFNRWKSC